MGALIRLLALAGLALILAGRFAWADCAADCSAAYRSCRGNPDTCLSQQGICLNRCTLSGPRERHGAIAYSTKKEVFGFSENFDNERLATQAAIRFCRQQDRGADDCRVLVTFYNACGAIALGDDGAHGADWAMNTRDAAAKALDRCRAGGANCKVERQYCTGR